MGIHFIFVGVGVSAAGQTDSLCLKFATCGFLFTIWPSCNGPSSDLFTSKNEVVLFANWDFPFGADELVAEMVVVSGDLLLQLLVFGIVVNHHFATHYFFVLLLVVSTP